MAEAETPISAGCPQSGLQAVGSRIVTAIQLLVILCTGDMVMIVATGLAVFVVVCLLLSMVQSPPEIGR